MGAQLPKAVESTVLERYESKAFRVGMAEMNGWRTNMEDEHLVHMGDDWGFFGVFDGHGGAQCSAFVAPRLQKALEEEGCPADDEAVRKMMFKIDQEFLDKEEDSGTTATMCIVQKPAEKGAKVQLRVINAGDSRVLLGRRDGTIYDGPGTDKGLTTDHKPDDPTEKERIYRCGGTVETAAGNCARVNGDLAVSRGFGDAKYKKTGGPEPENRPVTVDPELTRFECDECDFLLLVCDGVSEGDFPNASVVTLVADILRKTGDPGAAAKAVCHKAVTTNSKDNISCMVVLLDGGEEKKKEMEFTPGSTDKLGHDGYRTAYSAMAAKAKLSLAEAVEKRYNLLQVSPEELARLQEGDLGLRCSLKEEAASFGTPPGEPGSKERVEYFETWIKNRPTDDSGDGMPDMSSLMGGKGKGKGLGKGGYTADTADADNEEELETDGYSWRQVDDEIQITFKLAKTATKKDVKVNFESSALSVSVFGDSLLKGPLAGKVEPDDCTWTLPKSGAELEVTLFKQDAKDKWKGLMK